MITKGREKERENQLNTRADQMIDQQLKNEEVAESRIEPLIGPQSLDLVYIDNKEWNI